MNKYDKRVITAALQAKRVRTLFRVFDRHGDGWLL